MLDRLVDILLQFIELFKPWTVIMPYEGGVLIRLGKFVRVLEPGFHWVIPLGVDHVCSENVVPRTHSLEAQSTTTSDGKQIGWQAVITYKVRDVKVALLEVEDAEHAIKDSCSGTIGQVLSTLTWSDILSDSGYLDKVTSACRKKGFRYGLEVSAVQFSTMSLVKSLRLLGH